MDETGRQPWGQGHGWAALTARTSTSSAAPSHPLAAETRDVASVFPFLQDIGAGFETRSLSQRVLPWARGKAALQPRLPCRALPAPADQL